VPANWHTALHGCGGCGAAAVAAAVAVAAAAAIQKKRLKVDAHVI